MKMKIEEYEYNGIKYKGIMPLDVNSLALLPECAAEAEGPEPWLAMVQNECDVDYWLLDPSEVVGHTAELRRYYEEEYPWVVGSPRWLIRLFSLTQEIVY